MTRFTFGSKCSGWTTPLETNFGAAPSFAGSIDVSASAPRPVSELDRNVRRSASRRRISKVFMTIHGRGIEEALEEKYTDRPESVPLAGQGTRESTRECPLPSAEELAEQVILRIAVAEVLAVSFGEGDDALAAAVRAPFFHRCDVVVHPVMLDQPVSLADVGGEHLSLCVDHFANINAKAGCDLVAQRAFAFNRVAVIQMRDVRERRKVALEVKRDWSGERGGPDEGAGLLVVQVIARRAVGNHNGRFDHTQKLGHLRQGSRIVHHQQVALF